MKNEWIELIGARENNLKSVSVRIPKNQITVVTGLSGSGKSSLIFETLFLESQRRYLDGLSNYSKNFLDTFKKPDLDSLKGLSPAISVDQKTAGSSPRSTVGTLTEILDYLRLLYARLGTPRCPKHNIPVESSSIEYIVEWAHTHLKKKKVRILSPVVQSKKGEFTKELKKWEGLGFLKAYIDGELLYINEAPKLHKRKDHTIDIVVDQFKYDENYYERLKKSVARSFELHESMIVFEVDGVKKTFSIEASCPECGYSFPEMEPRHFSFNNKLGACEECGGLGTLDIVEYETEESIGSGGMYLRVKSKKYERAEELEEVSDCPACKGSRLNERARSVFITNKTIDEFSAMSAKNLLLEFKNIKLNKKPEISAPILKEITSRLEYLIEVGTGYLSLSRGSETLSGGERQRLRLASQLGSPLVGVLYVLDEPSIGLHSSDHEKLLNVIQKLKSQGNTIVIVEHDEETMLIADYIVEVGPLAGIHGGEIVFQDNFKKFLQHKPRTLTTSYLVKDKKVLREKKQKLDFKNKFSLKNVSLHNLKNVSVDFPKQALIGVSGVSGSGKSSLVMDILSEYGKKDFLSYGLDTFKAINKIDQKPIGKTPRSVPATYVGVYQLIRDLFAKLPESQVRGFGKGHFTFNGEQGRCVECNGMGVKKIDSHFLTEASVSCTSCNGKRFKPEVLTVQFKGKNIFDVLNLSIEEACEFFQNQRSIKKKLQTLMDVGLGYLKIGQSSVTLSGGEAQRLKLSKELSKSFRGEVLYILDEPTTGLHFEDVQKLLNLLSELVNAGHTVVIIEHQLDLLSQCDYLIDLGPGGGDEGGKIVDAGSPKEVAKRSKGLTGKHLQDFYLS